MDRQCPSCGGFCKKSGCERENTKPKREWVGLTDEEVDEIYMHEGHEDVVLLAQAKLKEKNT